MFLGGGAEAVDDAILARLYFGRDDAEHDLTDGLLRKGFLTTEAYEEALSGRKTLVIGRKGSGKSAICVRLTMDGVRHGATILITPDDAAGSEIRRFELQGLTNETAKSVVWRYVFAVQAARYITDHAKPEHGRRVPRTVRALRRFLKENGELGGSDRLYDRVVVGARGLQSTLSLEAFGFKASVDLKTSSEGARASRQIEVLEAGVAAALADLRCTESHEPLLLLVDQLEQVWSADEDSAAMVIGLLLASKHVAGVFGRAVRCVLFVRSDIYDALRFSDGDKFHGDERRIDWSVQALRQIALNRATASLGRGVSEDELWHEIFPATVDGEGTATYLLAHALPRPRDIIQFLNVCRDTAAGQGHTRIEAEDVLSATLIFSQWKLGDLAREYRVTYPYLERLFVLFQNAGYVVTRSAICRRFEYARRTLHENFPRFADVLTPDGIIEVLYGVSFLGVLRNGDVVYAGGSEPPIQPHEDEFHIHPCFRAALNTMQSTKFDEYRLLHLGGHAAAQDITNVILGRGVSYRPVRAFALLEALLQSCQRILRQLGRAQLPSETRERVSVEIGRIINSTDEFLRQAYSGGDSDLVLHFTHTVTYLRSLAAQLSREGFDENLTRRIEDETRRLMAHLSGAGEAEFPQG
jgi:hypothetical protein